MADIERIGVAEARQKVQAGQALLVCAYDDEDKCNKIRLEGAISLRALETSPPSRQRELIFYCA
ncbi:MAG: ArsR family transcriptional regulator [Candidatus Rokuibacteriota bacterium]